MDLHKKVDLGRRIRELQEEVRKLQQKQLELEEENAQSSLHTLEEMQPQHCEETRVLEEDVPSSLNNTQTQGESESLTKVSNLLVYEKTPGVEDHGKEFEKAMCVLYALKLIKDDSVYDFSMTTNNLKYGIFDDIELDVAFKDGSRRIFLFQLKYREDRETINQHMLTQQQGKKQQKNKFYLPNYLEGISKLGTNGENVVSMLYTNRPVKIDGHKLTCKSYTLEVTKCNEIQNKDLLLNTKSEKEIVFWFKPDCDSLGNETLEAACQRFFILSDQDDLETIRTNTKESLKNLLRCDVYSSFEHFMKNWWSDNFVLTKHHVIAKLTELALSPYIRTISASKSNEKAKKLAKAMTTFEITIVEESHEDTICEIWEEISKEHDWKSSPLHKFEIAKSGPTDLQKAKILWYLNITPLVVKMSVKNEETVKSVLHLLKIDSGKKNLILLGSKGRCDLENWDVFETLYDLKRNEKCYHDVVCSFHVSLQGRGHLALEQLINIDEEFTKIITITVLLKMSQTKRLVLGDEKEELPLLYMPRSVYVQTFRIYLLILLRNGGATVIINCTVDVKRNLQSRGIDFVELSDYFEDKNNNSYKNEILVSTTKKCTQTQFDQICSKVLYQNVFVFEALNDQYCYLLFARGDMSWFSSYKQSEEHIVESQVLDYFNGLLNICCAPPGMGKSLLLKVLKNNCSSEIWAIQIELINLNSFLAENTDFEAIKFHLMNLDETDEDSLTAKIKTIFWKNQKILLLLDGLDEVDSRFVKVIINFAKRVSSEGIKVWISSRENLREILNATLGVIPVEIEKLNREQQESYLRQQLITKYQAENVEKIVKTVFESVDICNSQDVLGIPLQLHVITEMFLNSEEAYNSIDKQNIFVLTYMYKFFLNGKAKTLFVQLGIDDVLKSHLDISHEKLLEIYELPGLKACLDYSDYEKLQVNEEKEQKFLKTLRKERDKLGVIKTVDKTLRVVFNHQTYAEYFACKWLRKHKDKIRLLSDTIFSPRYDNLRRMFDIMMAENSPLHLAVIYKNLDEFDINFCDVEKRDEGGRNLLHLACTYGGRYAEKYFFAALQRESSFYMELMGRLLQHSMKTDEVDDLFNVDCVTYALRSRCLYPIEKMLEKEFIHFKDLYLIMCNIFTLEDLVSYAAQFGYPNLLRELVKLEPQLVTYRSPIGESLLHLAVLGIPGDNCLKPRSGNIRAVKVLLAHGLNFEEENLNQLLPHACKIGCYDMLPLLIDNGLLCFNGNTILHTMLQKRNLSKEESIKVVDIAQCLNIDFNAQNFKGKTALTVACKHGHLDAVKLLLDGGADPSITNKLNRNSMHYACSSYKPNNEILILLINYGLDVNQQDQNGTAAIHLASRHGNAGLMKLLLQNGADRNIRDEENNSVLHYACMLGRPNEEVIHLIIDLGFDVNDQSKIGETATHFACDSNCLVNVQVLLKNGTDPNIVDKNKYNALHVVYQRRSILDKKNNLFRNKEIVKLLVSYDINVNAQDVNGTTGLHLECQFRDSDIIELFLERGADPNITDNVSRNSLHYACGLNNAEMSIINLLINAGVDVNVQDKYGKTALLLANQRNRIDIAKLVLGRGADVNVKDNESKTALHHACDTYTPNVEMIKLLISYNINVNAQDKHGLTALHYGCRHELDYIVSLLLERGADPNIKSNSSRIYLNFQDENGTTPLQIACENFYLDLIEILLKKGANSNIEDNETKNSFHYVNKHWYDIRNVKVIKILLHYGFDVNAQDKNGTTVLQFACSKNYVEITELLLNSGANPNIKDDRSRNALAYVLESYEPNIQIVSMLLNSGADVNARDEFGSSPLLIACRKHNIEIMRILLMKGADPNMIYKENRNALHFAYFYGVHLDLDSVTLLLNFGIDVNAQDEEGTTALHLACKKGHGDISKLLEDRGAVRDIADYDGRNLLHYACTASQPNTEMISFLINSGFDVNAPDINGITPLSTACDYGHVDNVKLLLEEGADSNAKDSEGTNALHHACQMYESKTELVKLLLRSGIDVNAQNEDGKTALHFACEGCDVAVTELLLKNGASPNIADNENKNPLHYTLKSYKSKSDKREITDLLIKYDIDLNARNMDGTTALQIACENDHCMDIIKLLLESGADPNIEDKNGRNTLHYADMSSFEITEKLCLLIEYGINVNYRNENGATALHLACQEGNTSIVNSLLEKGADPNITDYRGRSVLHYACTKYGSNLGTVNLFKNVDLDLNKQDENGVTALQLACESGQDDTVKFLLKKGADPKIQDAKNRNALHYSCSLWRSNVEVIELLVNSGLNVNAKDLSGTSPLHLAFQCVSSFISSFGDIDNINFLLKNGADPFAKDNVGRNALHYACQSYNLHKGIINFLVELGFNVNDQDRDGTTALHIACQHCNIGSIRLLLDNGADANIRDQENRNALLHLLESSSYSVEKITLLIDYGADVNTQRRDGVTGLHLAFERGYIEDVNVFLQKGADVLIKDNRSRNVLHYAAECLVDTQMIKLFQRFGIDVNEQDENGGTALHTACQCGGVYNVKALLQKGANYFITDNEDRNALHYACMAKKKNSRTIRFFINRDFDVNAQDKNGITGLQLACECGILENVKFLVRRGADPYIVDNEGKNALDYARRSANSNKLTQYLLGNRTEYGRNPITI